MPAARATPYTTYKAPETFANRIVDNQLSLNLRITTHDVAGSLDSCAIQTP